MRKTLKIVSFGVALALAGCGGGPEKKETAASKTGDHACACGTAKPAAATADAPTCSCADVNAKKAGWCAHCGMGYAEGKMTKCEKCAKANKMCASCPTDGGKCADCSKG